MAAHPGGARGSGPYEKRNVIGATPVYVIIATAAGAKISSLSIS
jgi:hypothetical protein